MRTPIAFALTLLCAPLVSATDITLNDGRVFINAVVLKQDSTTVTLRHSGGFSQVEKSKLPDDLSAQYPIDESAAAQQHAAELDWAKQVSAMQAARTEQLKKAAAIRGPAVPAPAPLSSVVRPRLTNDRERWKWRTIPLSIQPSKTEINKARWEKIYEGTGRHLRTPLVLTGKLWRVLVQQETQIGKLSYVSAIVSNAEGYKLACSFARNGADPTAYGNVVGPATLDVMSEGGPVRVVVEQQVEASSW